MSWSSDDPRGRAERFRPDQFLPFLIPLMLFLAGFLLSTLSLEAEEWEIPHRPAVGIPRPILLLTPTPTPSPETPASPSRPQPTPTPPEGLDPEVLRRLPPHLQSHPLARVVWRPAAGLAKRLRERGAWLPDYRECQEGDNMCVFETQGEAISYIQRVWASGILRKGVAAYCKPWAGLVDGKPLPTPTPEPPDRIVDVSTYPCAPGLTCYILFDEEIFWGYAGEDEVRRVSLEWTAFRLFQIMDKEVRDLVDLRWPFKMCRRAFGGTP